MSYKSTHKPLVAIVGRSGSGKSSSLEHLPPSETIIIDTERKGFPFPLKSWAGRIVGCDTKLEIESAIASALKDPSVKYIVVESLTKVFEIYEATAQASFKGYDIWTYYNKSIAGFFELCKNRQATVVFTAIDEVLKSELPEGGVDIARRIKVKGKAWEGIVEKEMLVVFYSWVKRDAKIPDKVDYLFRTNSDGINPAKSPKFFGYPLDIPNNLMAAFELANKNAKSAEETGFGEEGK